MTGDAPDVFMQAPMESKDGEDQASVKITGVLVDVPPERNPKKHSRCAVCE